MKGCIIATTISTTAINALLQCAEPITIPPYTNAFIKCKVPNILKSMNYERVCVFEPSYRHKPYYSHCNTYEGIVVMDDDVVDSGIFQIVMTNHSPKHVKINNQQSMSMLLCDEENICTIHNIATFEPIDSTMKPREVEKELYCIPIRNTSNGKN